MKGPWGELWPEALDASEGQCEGCLGLEPPTPDDPEAKPHAHGHLGPSRAPAVKQKVRARVCTGHGTSLFLPLSFFFLRHQRFFLGHLYFCLTDFVRGSEMKPSIISHVLREIHVTDIWNLGFQIATWMKVCNLNEVSQ